jgi:hypothetical protein
MLAVIVAALGVFSLGVAAVLSSAGDRRGYRRALVAAVALAVVAAGIGIAGIVRWRDCVKGFRGNDFRVTEDVNPDGSARTERCPQRVLGVRDPF